MLAFRDYSYHSNLSKDVPIAVTQLLNYCVLYTAENGVSVLHAKLYPWLLLY